MRPKGREAKREEKSEGKRSQKRREEKLEERRWDGRSVITRTIPGSGTQWLDPRRDGGPAAWINSGLLRRRSGVGTQRGLSTPAPWKRNHRLTDTKDSGIGTVGTRGPRWSGASGIRKAHRITGSDRVVASTPRSEALMFPDYGGPIMAITTTEVGDAGDGREARYDVTPGAGVLETVSPLGRPNAGLSKTLASRRPGRFNNTPVPRFNGTVCWQ